MTRTDNIVTNPYMAHFLFIHGAWHGGWCFDALAPLLAAHGNTMSAPDLPGMGGTEEELAAVTLAGWADYVADLARAMPSPLILAGHSRGGIVISEVAERIPEQICALVYITAMMLPSGMARTDLKTIFSPNKPFENIISPTPGRGGSVVDKTRAPDIFAQLAPRPMAEAAAARTVAEPAAPRTTPLHLTAERYGRLPRHYVECTEDRTIPLADQQRMIAMQPDTIVHTLESDHSPYLCMPERLTEILAAITG
ncbi:MAG: alpha/beta fold hydrolase [Alphaproteobacteria bacterium]|nr:alpha/beta fold hydrolase [Alphaproteobacteria bacterium]MDE2340257.1 alpha/beta fold hydrolase [Alphaproteobacteria bacterium]